MATTFIAMAQEMTLAKRIKIQPAQELLDDRYLTVEDVQHLLSISASHVYMLEKMGHIESINITCSGTSNNSGKRFSLHSLQNFITSRRQNNGENHE